MTGRSFSLVEIVIALAILAVGAAIAIRFFPIGLSASSLAASVTLGSTLAQEKLEELKSQTALTSGTTEGDFSEQGYSNYRYTQVIIEETNRENYHRLYKIYLTVSWDFRGQTRSEEFMTYIAGR